MIHITGCHENFIELVEKLNYDLRNFLNYLNMSKLKLNVEKTNFMLIGSQAEECQIVIDNINIERVNSIKYLGVIIDVKMNFKDHLEYVKKKMAKKAYFLSRMKNKLDKETKRMLYKTLIVPHITVVVFVFK